jgi:hypothetical protein
MARVVTLADFRPSRREDEASWTGARVEEADEFGGEWSEVKVFDLDPLDEDPTGPALRGFTVATDKEWLRVVFVDGDENEDEPSALFATSGAPFRPTIDQVSAILRARTYTDAGENVVGGELAEEFNSDTRPTAEQVEDDLIPDACTDVVRSVGRIPGFLLGDARRVAALGVCKEIERSYIPEQAEPDASIFQTLRLTLDEEMDKLRRTLQWSAVSQHLESS